MSQVEIDLVLALLKYELEVRFKDSIKSDISHALLSLTRIGLGFLVKK